MEQRQKDKVFSIPGWPRPGQVSRAWALCTSDSWGRDWIEGLYERYEDAEEDARGIGGYSIRETNIIFGLDEQWHPIRFYLGSPQPRRQSKAQDKRDIATRARSKLTSEELEALVAGSQV